MERAVGAGVEAFVCNGTSEADWAGVAELAKTCGRVVPCFGLHPWFVSQRSEGWERVLKGYLEKWPGAVGEIGLDRWIEPRDEKVQEEVFRRQLGMARELGRPVMIHCLRAWDWLMRVLDEEGPLPGGMVIHAYGGPVELVGPLVERGAYLSFAGNVLEAKRAKAREAMRAVPGERLLVETDGPDMLPPRGYRDYGDEGRNEPGNLAAIVRGVAEVRGETVEQVAGMVWGNARRLLGGLVQWR